MISNFFVLTDSINFQTSSVLLLVTGLLLIITCFKLIAAGSLIETVITMSVFSLLLSLCYLLMDAPDVAMTEVALGSCLSTCVLLNFIKIVDAPPQPVKQTRIIMASSLCLLFIAVLSWASFDLPEYGAENSAMQNHISKYYIENTKSDTGLQSLVAAILASYRGYDTLGETSVILIAGLAALLILNDFTLSRSSKQAKSLKDFLIIRTLTLFILPYIFLYSLYIQINGEISPGGGFQAGVIFAAAIIGFDLINGRLQTLQHLSINLLMIASVLGVLIYAGTGIISFIFDDNYLNYYSLATDKHLGQTIGIFSIEIGVGLTVAAVMCLIYFLLQEKEN